MACLQLRGLLRLLDDGVDPVTVAAPVGDWCDEHVRPWVVDHVAIDTGAVRRWQGEELDLSRPEESLRRIRALSPHIGARGELHGRRVTIWQARLEDGELVPVEVQPDGGRRMALEVNLLPPNPGSLAFHAGRGYAEVGRLGDPAHLVSLMTKEL